MARASEGAELQARQHPNATVRTVSVRQSVRTAARIWGILRESAAGTLIVLDNMGYQARETSANGLPDRNKPASQKAANPAPG